MPRTPGNRKVGTLMARLTAEQKETIGRAAALLGLSVPNFIVASALQAAEKVIGEHNIVKLTAQDSLAFAEAILKPRTPDEKLREAFAQHNRLALRVASPS